MFSKLMAVFNTGVMFEIILNDGLPRGIPLVARTRACLDNGIEGVCPIHVPDEENPVSIPETHVLNYDGLGRTAWARRGYLFRWCRNKLGHCADWEKRDR
jgi:hypothetical protein